MRREAVSHGPKDAGVDEKIDSIARALSERFGARALSVAARQFDQAEDEAKLVWGQIMEWLILHAEDDREA
jgi:hypothetical protein